MSQSLAPLLLTAPVLAAALITDLRARRIPDRLTLPALALALLIHGFGWGWSASPGAGLGWSLAGAAAAALPFLLFELCLPGAFGGGDLKLLAAVGAALGFPLAGEAALRVALAGGVLGGAALARAWLRGEAGGAGHVPYAVAIAAGVAWTAWERLP